MLSFFLSISQNSALNLPRKCSEIPVRAHCGSHLVRTPTITSGDTWQTHDYVSTPIQPSATVTVTARVCTKLGNSEEFGSTAQAWSVGAFQDIDASSS